MIETSVLVDVWARYPIICPCAMNLSSVGKRDDVRISDQIDWTTGFENDGSVTKRGFILVTSKVLAKLVLAALTSRS